MRGKWVVLAGALVVGVSYVVASDRLGQPESATHAAVVGDAREAAPAAQVHVGAQQPRDPSSAGDRKQLAALTGEMARLKAEVEVMRDEQPSPPERAPAAEPPPKTAEQEAAEREEYMAGVERAFESEPRDDKWAAGTSQLLRQSLASEPIMLAALRGIECRSRSCRMEIRDDGSNAFADEFPIAVHQLGAVLPEVDFAHATLDDGSQLHVMYMSKGSTASSDEP